MTELTENEVNEIKEALKQAKEELRYIHNCHEGWPTSNEIKKINKALRILSQNIKEDRGVSR